MDDFLKDLGSMVERNNQITPAAYDRWEVKRGLRNEDGTGVLVGLTEIGSVHGYYLDERERVPDHGRLSYRGIEVKDLSRGFQEENRLGFEEVIFLLLFGDLPDPGTLEKFTQLIAEYTELPERFNETMILSAPSDDIMNKLARSVLALYTYDDNPDDISISNVLRQCLQLISRFPMLVAYAYRALAHYYKGRSLHVHPARRELCVAENFLHVLRKDNQFTRLEAEALDLALVLHAEHGGGNNSSFTVHVVTSSDTDTYSAMAAALGSLKGPKHGGANARVMGMMQDIKENVSDWTDEDEVANYLAKILKGEAYDKRGLIYGIGHAVYTLSDPRAVIFKEKAKALAQQLGEAREREMNLYLSVEKLGPQVFQEVKGSDKVVAANVDFFSGFVYDMLGFPSEIYTAMFAMSRIAGWSAHRIEELINGGRIIRPMYKSIVTKRPYRPLGERT